MAGRSGPRSRVGDSAGPDACVPEGRDRRPGVVLRRRRIASISRCGSTACWPRRDSSSGWKESRSIPPASSTPRTASRGWRSFPSPTSGTRSACSSSRCSSTRWWRGCGRRPARRVCAPSSTWTRSSDISRRSPTRPRRARSSRCSSRGVRSASACCWRPRTRWTSITRGWRTSALGFWAGCRPNATRIGCSTASRGRRPGPSIGRQQIASCRRSTSACSSSTTCTPARRWCSRAAGPSRTCGVRSRAIRSRC